MKARVGIVGFRGYSGAELVRLLGRHPSVEPVLVEHRERFDTPATGIPSSAHATVPCAPEALQEARLALVFLATPAEVSAELAAWLLETGARLIDLSGAFRFGASAAGMQAVYGLPEMYRERIAGARFIANPGCYPTAANLALEPLMAAGVVDLGAGVVCDAKSGVSGAGRQPSLRTSFCEATENLSAYAVLTHRHVPEILMVSGLEDAQLSFTAQLAPLDRGILETIYFRAARAISPADLLEIYTRRYGQEPFIRLYAPGQAPDVRAVQRTNFCDIGFVLDAASGRAVVICAIDNLVKGAAGQAVQNMNLALGFPEREGLL